MDTRFVAHIERTLGDHVQPRSAEHAHSRDNLARVHTVDMRHDPHVRQRMQQGDNQMDTHAHVRTVDNPDDLCELLLMHMHCPTDNHSHASNEGKLAVHSDKQQPQ
mmetsp:Transcript_38820/g.77358  ORF Transcript_38820/g.77358 Transcript_38820/m.77358 type:complete len:106 (+) Transcript_38820:358-675(+)